MPTHDKFGRAYAKLSQLKVGDTIEADGDFDCILDKQICLVDKSSDGFFVYCGQGKHFLDGQLDKDRDTLIGFYPVEKSND